MSEFHAFLLVEFVVVFLATLIGGELIRWFYGTRAGRALTALFLRLGDWFQQLIDLVQALFTALTPRRFR